MTLQANLKVDSKPFLEGHLTYDEWHRVSKMTSGRTQHQRKLVNSAIDGTKQGGLLLNTEKPMFQKLRESYVKNESSEKTKALSKTLFMGKFNLERSPWPWALQQSISS